MKFLTRWNFVLLIIIVTIIQFLLLKITLQNGFTSDDWWILFDYKTIGRDLGFLEKYFTTLRVTGLHHAYQIMYVGLLENLFRGNYQAYQITSILFKILATISLYPLILAVFKRRLLAFLTTILYSISYSSVGAMLFVCIGSDYLAIFFMNIFLLSYYYYFITKRKHLLYTATLLLFLSFMSSPIRMYPLLGFVVLIEVFVWIKSKKILGILTLLSRLFILFLPFFILSLIGKGLVAKGHMEGPLIVYNFLSYGNYQLLLPPFAGIGYTFLTNDYWGIFGKLTFYSFKDYLFFLLRGPVIIYTLLTILLGFLLTKKPLRFILAILFTNLIFEVVCYFFITNLRGVEGPNVKGFYEISTYAVFFGFFVVSIAISALFIWLKNHKSNILLMSVFIGPIFSSVFFWGTWLIKGDVLTFKEGIHWYMVIAAIGSCLFLASIMDILFDRIKILVNPHLKRFLMIFLFLTILPIYLISRREINTTFTNLLNSGYGASDQEQMKSKLLSYIQDPLETNPALFYFEAPNQIFFPISLQAGFEELMHFRDWEIVRGCVGLIFDKNVLEKSVTIKGGIKGFNASSLCVGDFFEVERHEVFYKPENFHAFRLSDRDVIDIRERVLKDLKF